MVGLGTIVNVIAIILGGILGLTGGKFLTERFQRALILSCGVSTIFIGIGGVMAQMLQLSDGRLSAEGSMMLIGSLVGGALIGEFLKIEDHMEQFGTWLKQKTGNAEDGSFVGGFVTASLTVCIGAMAIVGSIEDGIYGNHAILFTKAVLDFIIILILSASLGKGCVFSALSVGLVQGVVTALSRLIEPVMTTRALAGLSFVGSAMIFCVGVNLILGVWFPDAAEPGHDGAASRVPVRIRVGNLLPGLIIAVVWSFFS